MNEGFAEGQVSSFTMSRSPTIGEIAKALAVAQGMMAPAAKDSVNPHFKSKYADLASVWEAARIPLSKAEIAIVQIPAVSANGNVQVNTHMIHASGEWFYSELEMSSRDKTPQAMGSTITYARRYALSSMVGVAPDDDDGNAVSRGEGDRPETYREERPRQEAQRQTPAPAPSAPRPTSPGVVMGQEYANLIQKAGREGTTADVMKLWEACQSEADLNAKIIGRIKPYYEKALAAAGARGATPAPPGEPADEMGGRM